MIVVISFYLRMRVSCLENYLNFIVSKTRFESFYLFQVHFKGLDWGQRREEQCKIGVPHPFERQKMSLFKETFCYWGRGRPSCLPLTTVLTLRNKQFLQINEMPNLPSRAIYAGTKPRAGTRGIARPTPNLHSVAPLCLACPKIRKKTCFCVSVFDATDRFW